MSPFSHCRHVPRSLLRILTGVVAGAALAWASTARAEPTEAEALFLKGRAELKAGRLEAACSLLAQSFASAPAPGTLLNWGLCEERRGHHVAAWEKLHRFLATIGADDERLQLAERHLRAIESQVALLRVRVVPEPSHAAHVFVDGARMDANDLGDFVAVDIGEHRVQLKTGEKLLQAKAVSVSAGERLELSLVGVDIPAPAPAPLVLAPRRVATTPKLPRTIPSSASRQSSNHAAFVAGSFAATGLLASLVFGGVALHEKGLAEAHCQNKLCDDTGLRATEAGRRYVSFANVALLVGGAAAATCGVLLWQSHAGQSLVAVSWERVTVSQRWSF